MYIHFRDSDSTRSMQKVKGERVIKKKMAKNNRRNNFYRTHCYYQKNSAGLSFDSRTVSFHFQCPPEPCPRHRIVARTRGINLTAVGIYEQKWSHLHSRKVKFMEGVGI